jgi:hypothetical protein
LRLFGYQEVGTSVPTKIVVPLGVLTPEASGAKQAAEKAIFVIPSEARDLLFLPVSKKQQIPRANPPFGMTGCEFFRSL